MTNRILGVISHSGNPDSLIEAHQALTHRTPTIGNTDTAINRAGCLDLTQTTLSPA